MKYKNKFALIVASCTILFFGAQVEAQLISIGPAGVRVRGARSERFSVGRSGVHIRQPQTRPHVHPQRHGVVLRETPYQQHHAHEDGNVHQGARQSVTTPRSARSGNFIVTNEAASAFQTAAESSFSSGDLNYAAQSVAMAIRMDRDNGFLHLFASHVYFAIGDYHAAAREIDIATRIVPINQWGAIIRNADRLAIRQHYEAQFHQLHRYLDHNPTSTDARVVYGFYSAVRGERRVASDQSSSKKAMVLFDQSFTCSKW